MPVWNRIPPPQCAFINGKGHHFKKNHCPWTWQESVDLDVVPAVNFVLVPSLSHIQLPHVIAGVVDGINGVTKTKLTSATARKLLDPDDGIDVKKLDNSTMRKGKKVSIAVEMAGWLELDGCEGTKSVKKNKKREDKSEFKRFHWIVRDGEEKLSGLKCEALDLPKRVSASEMYHVYCCPELGVQKIAVRRIPCHCIACRSTLKLLSLIHI